MQVGTTLPQVVFMGTGALGQGANGRAWPYNWTCNFKYLSTCSTWARPKQVPWGCHVLSRRRTVLPARTT